jgi:hypothetical protein
MPRFGPNIFLVQLLRLGDEDQLTANWHYVLSVTPGVGQLFIDQIAALAGIAPSQFLGVIDHPTGDQENHPDVLLRCADYSVLFEHKAGSPLGANQLERYLNLARSRGWRLALVTGDPVTIPQDVLDATDYLRPTGAAHFLWQDIHELLASSQDHIVQEFRDYLQAIGLHRFSWAGLGDPFLSSAAADALRDLYKDLRALFAPPASCRLRPRTLTFEIRRPFDPIHLINISPVRSVAQFDSRLWGAVMAVTVWVRQREGRRVLSEDVGHFASSVGDVRFTSYSSLKPLAYDRAVVPEREYYMPLDAVLTDSASTAATNLKAFVTASVTHLYGELAVGQT